MVVDEQTLDELTAQAKASPRLRMNYDLRNSAADQSQRMLNAIEPGTVMPIHRHMGSSETVICIRGHFVEKFYDEHGILTEAVDMVPGGLMVNVPAGQWHNLESLEPGTEIPIHRHPEKDESFVVLRGKVRSTTYKENCSAIESVVLCPEVGLYGVDIPQGVWHKHPRDNAIAERVNGILKTEWLYDDHFPSNHKQPPLSLNHQTPAPPPANPETGAQARVWKNPYKANKPEEVELVI